MFWAIILTFISLMISAGELELCERPWRKCRHGCKQRARTCRLRQSSWFADPVVSGHTEIAEAEGFHQAKFVGNVDVAETSADAEFHFALELLPAVLEPRLAVRLVNPLKTSVNGVLICAWLYWNWPLKSSRLMRRRRQVELFGRDKRVHVLEQAVIEEAITGWIGDPVHERHRCRGFRC